MEVYETLPIVPLRDVVVFPHMMMPFVIGRPSSTRALEHALLKDKRIFLAAQHDASVDDPRPEDIFTMGCVANVVQSLKLPDGNIKVLVEGVDRARAVEWKEDKGFYRVVVKVLAKQRETSADAESTMSRVVSLFEQYVKLSNNLNFDAMIAAVRVDDPGKLADTIAAHLLVGVDEKQNLLEIISPLERLNRIAGILETEVGKTSLAKSIARAMNRKFVRLSLGGVRDEAEIRGHRRTYIGAFPGQIIQMMKKAGTMNPVFLLDEVDKMSMDFRGDPSAALLEVLDPEQNNTFLDHYLDVEYDLSNVMFICTANVLHTIPQALRDRMEVLQLAGYTEIEKVQIATKFLSPKAVENVGLTKENINFTEESFSTIIQRYTREAGVRNLEREIASVCRKVARKVVVEGKGFFEEINSEKVTQYLGVPRFRNTMAEETNEIGIATGLAWTEVGGEILVTEATLMPGKGHLTLTGKLGDVMQESAQAAMSYVRSKAEEFGIEKDFNKRTDVHIHVPEGAIPKDGPSAGITLATALVSALARVPIRKDVAMTGEITLRGKVLPIGGVKEKVLAAHRAGLKNIVLPKDNEKDLADIPKNVLDTLNVYMVQTMDEVLKIALAEPLVVRLPAAPQAEPVDIVDDTITH